MTYSRSAAAAAQSPTRDISNSVFKYRTRAKFYPQPDGGLKLATVQTFSFPMFSDSDGFELTELGGCDIDNDIQLALNFDSEEEKRKKQLGNSERALRRARIAVYDIAMCNPQLDTFITLTYAPESVASKASYDECYAKLRPFLSNAVQRHNLSYVGVPELTKKGDVHFHFLANHEALDLVRARSTKTGRVMSRKGAPLYNVTNWHVGFSTAQIVTPRSEGADAHTATSKYMTKYMTKSDCKVGGRYYLSGGVLKRPIYVYGDSENEFFDPTDMPPRYEKTAQMQGRDGGFEYRLYSFT